MDSLVGSPELTGMPHGTGIGNPVEEKAMLIINLKNKLEKRREKALKELTKIELYIANIESTDTRLIFTKRYIQFKRWDEITKEMCMSKSNVFRRHQEQLKSNQK